MASANRKARGAATGRRLPTEGYEDISIPAGVVCRMEAGHRSARVTCLDGIVWITQSKNTTDYLMSAGDSLTVICPGVLLIQGLPEGRVRLAPAAEAGSKLGDLWHANAPASASGLAGS